MKKIDMNTWERKETYEFFSQFDEPFFGIVSEVDCSAAYTVAKNKKRSFFAHYLHKALIALNGIDAFKYRHQNNGIVFFDVLHSATTIGRADGSFGFSFSPFDESFDRFNKMLQDEINDVKESSGLRLSENTARKDAIHFSPIPFTIITGMSHARNFKTDDVPKIAFGKVFERDEKKIMNVSVNIHHGFGDAFHVSLFLEKFQKLLNEK